MSPSISDDILRVIQARKTQKFIGTPDAPLPTKDGFDFTDLLEAARWAPFHKASHASHQQTLNSKLPYRFYCLDSRACRLLLDQLLAWEKSPETVEDKYGKMPALGKIAGMLAAADALMMATWLPNPPQACEPAFGCYEGSLANMEHIAAASSAIQNLLLTATAKGIANYWSSGGAIFRSKLVYDHLEIPHSEILLGSLFLFPAELNSNCPESVTEATGKLRDHRGEHGDFSKVIVL